LNFDDPMTRSPDSTTWSSVARRVRVPLGFLFAVAYVWLSRPTRTSLLAGGLLLLPGLLLRGLASGHVEKNERLATSGPYAYIRNPLYLGSLILAAGFAVAARSWWIAAITILIFIVIYVPVIAAEERFLRQTFPEYEDYARFVPSLWPRLTPFPGPPGSFSAALYCKHREYNALVGCLAVVVILVFKLVLK
jgi:protein-S-isoprenylcysteine O-methyltransferase Ste14